MSAFPHIPPGSVVSVALAAGLVAACHQSEADAAAARERAEIRRAARRAAAMVAEARGDSGQWVATGSDASPDSARLMQQERARAVAGARAARAADTTHRGSTGIGLGGKQHLAYGRPMVPLGPGDVRVTSSDGAIVLALTGDSVRMRVTDSLAARVKREVAQDADKESGFGGFLARTVSGAVGTAMKYATNVEVSTPVAEVHDMRYADGELRIGSNDGGRKDRGMHMSARFARADAERFMAAVRRRQAGASTF